MVRGIFFTALITLSIFSIVIYSGCTKLDPADPCDDITCQHGGSCVSGVCYCVGDYTGTYCEKRKCEVDNTARVRFENKSSIGKTYTIIWDGLVMTNISPGSTSEYYTVAAGKHTLLFKYANESNNACNLSEPVLIQCKDHSYFCVY